MSAIIAITGPACAGKTTLSKKFSPRAFVLECDLLLKDVSTRAFPFMRPEYALLFEVWPRDLQSMYMDKLLNISFSAVCPNIFAHRGPVIVEGAIVSQEWFRTPLVTAIKFSCSMDPHVPLHLFDFIPPAGIIKQNAALRNPEGVPPPYSDLEELQKLNEYAAERTANENWRRISDADALEEAIRQALAA